MTMLPPSVAKRSPKLATAAATAAVDGIAVGWSRCTAILGTTTTTAAWCAVVPLILRRGQRLADALVRGQGGVKRV